MKKEKRYRFIMLAMLAVFLITACGNSVDPVSQKMVEDINAIGEVTKEDEAQIRKLLERYATLTEKQKEQVSNYNVLLEAEDYLDQIISSENEQVKPTNKSDIAATTVEETDSVEFSKKEVWDLAGSWCDDAVANGKPGLAAYIDESSIIVYWVAENQKVRTPFWIGSYAPVIGETDFSWESHNNYDEQPYCVWASPDETKEFTYKNGIIHVPKSSGDVYLRPTEIDFSDGFDYIVEDTSKTEISIGNISFDIPAAFSRYSDSEEQNIFISSQAYLFFNHQNTKSNHGIEITESIFREICKEINAGVLKEMKDGSIAEETYKNSEGLYKYQGIINGVYSDTIGKMVVTILGNPEDNNIITIFTLISDKANHDYLGDLSEMAVEAKNTTAHEKTDKETKSKVSSGISKEFKEAMDGYEEYFDKYIEVMTSMKNNPGNLSMMQEYTEMMGTYADTMQKFEAIEGSDMTPEEEAYYLEVSMRINQKLMEAAKQ